MKKLYAAGFTLALSFLASHHAFAQKTDQIIGGYTTLTFSSTFLDFTQESGITVTDLGGNALLNGIDILPGAQGAIDLQTGVTNVVFKGGLQAVYLGKVTVRVENLILHANETSSAITGDVIENGTLLGRQEIFVVNRNPDLSLPLQVKNGVLTLPTLSLGLSPNFVTQLSKIIGPLVNAGTVIATAAPIAVVVPDTPAAR